MENMYGNVILQDKENIWELFLSKYFIPNIWKLIFLRRIWIN
jgi:hypothetical protein